jgi:uncharacterized protein (TIGR03067 family)
MSRLMVGLLLLASGSVAQADDDPEPRRPAEAELKKLQGTWDVVKAVMAGRDDTAKLKKDGAHAVIKKNEFTFVERQGRKDSMSFVLNQKQKPGRMDLSDGNETIRAIYKLEKDVLTIAFNDEGKEHPKGFDKSDGLLVLKRRAVKK